MGHLHVSKIKFRLPVPDVISCRMARDSRQHRQQTDNTNYLAADFLADSSGNACLDSPIWISSTIPDGWIWQQPSQLDLPTDPDIHIVTRQSTCQLEGDASVDEIINQQFLSYSSLSQTGSDVKMVQSLVPIWEEEFERTGMHGASLLSEPGKPLPKDVLRTLSHGLEFMDNFFMELHTDSSTRSRNEMMFSLCTRSSIDTHNVDEFGHTYSENKRELLKSSKEINEIGALLSRDTPDIIAKHEEALDACTEQLSADELQVLGTVGASDVKAADQEALMLLKWLASSQAAEDINSDDELARDTILSPLLPATTMEKVLEKANMDYESQSQQECRDILDCVENSIDFEGLKGNKSQSIDHCQKSSKKTIPQVDDSSDDQMLIPCATKSTEIEMNSESDKSLQTNVQHDFGSSSTKHKRKRVLRSSLPFSLNEKVNDAIQPKSSNLSGRSNNEHKDGIVTCFGGGNETNRCCSVAMGDADKDLGCSEEASTTFGSSMRDLMRRKRCYRVEPPECETPHSKVPFEDWKKDSSLCTKGGDNSQDKKPPKCRSPLSNEQTEICERYMFEANSESEEACDVKPDNSICSKYGKLPLVSCNTRSFPTSVSDYRSSHSFEGINDLVVTAANVRSGNRFHGPFSMHGQITKIPKLLNSETENQNSAAQIGCCENTNCEDCVLGSDSLISMVANTEVNSMELIGMGFYKKPPLLQWTNGISGNAPVSSAILNYPCPTDQNYEATSVQNKLLDDCLPFFVRDCIEGQEFQDVRSIAEDFNHQQEGIMGVPTYFQNDGSYLYMLTPAISPPSTDGVKRWLLQDGTGSSGNLMDSQGSQADACSEPLMESGSKPDEDSVVDQVNQQNQGSHNAELQPFYNDATKILQTDGNILNMKQNTGCSEDFSQISGPDGRPKLTPISQIGFRDPASVGGGQQLTVFSIEVQAASRGDSRPDPRLDAINFIILVIHEDDDLVIDTYCLLRSDTGHVQRNLDGISGCKVLVLSEEQHLFNHFIEIICSFDPDILMGWDIQSGSLGFLAERAAHLGIGLLNKISRTPSQTNVLGRDSDVPAKGIISDALPESAVADSVVLEDAIIEDEWGRTHASGVHVSGRIVLNVWRLVRSEVKLNMYSAEAVAEEVLRRKIPFIPCKVLTRWFSSGPGRARYRCIEYVMERAKLNLQIITQLDMINRTSELARVFGIDFFSVLSRGSQYRVESMLLRLAHTQNYLAIAPGSQQVASQPAMECLPLVMEPESGFYADPVVVLDFQSLYPSMIITYNLCFSTCLGKVKPSKSDTLGVSSYSPDSNVLLDLKHEILLTPNGVMYVPSKVRKGVLPRLLEEILSTRIMVKQAMKKLVPSQQVLKRIFNARQLALKLIANVTYGYTAAGFSGRMPCAELADSIVQCGRRTLETAISFVNAHDKWKAKVLYGDTDSMFVLLRGRSVKEALKIGQDIASTVTAMNPSPVTLKLEKVYHPCFLLTKKRYVGYSYESPNQVDPIFDAKGIETVRRDTCAALSKTMEQSLRLYFEHEDINKVKLYLLRQWKRILSGRVSLQDFVFAKEVRLGTYSTRASSLPPAAIVAIKAMRTDPRAEPRYAERIPYVVVHGEPGARLVDMVVDPLDLLEIDSPFRLNDLYYINKQIIPALQRVFGLVGADLNRWFQDMPRPGQKVFNKRQYNALNPHRTRIDYYYLSKHCILCGELVQASAYLCSKCSENEAIVATAMVGRTSKLEREIQHLADICRHCGGGDWIIESGVKCTSLACSIFYERKKIQKELLSLSAVATEANFYPRCMVEWF